MVPLVEMSQFSSQGGGGQHKVEYWAVQVFERIGGHDEIDGGEHLVDHLVGIGALVDEVRGGDVEEVDWHGIARDGRVVDLRALEDAGVAVRFDRYCTGLGWRP